jgi:hypothetical protein
MKLKNSTDWPDHFLRRMAAWCCRQSGLPVRKLRRAEFRNRLARAYSGHADWSGRIVCSIGPAERFPLREDHRDGMSNEVMADRTEALVAITAHEVEHICQYREGRDSKLTERRRSEPATRAHEVRVLRLFRANREALLAEWSAEPAAKPAKPRPTRQQINEANTRKLLAAWERKLKLAKTKVSTYRRKARYYDRVAANRSVTQ